MNRSIAALAVLLALTVLATSPAGAAGFDWPQWRGPNRDDISKETGLLKTWPAEGPKQAWIFTNSGSGYGGPAIVGGKLFTTGTRDYKEQLIALDASTGTELWAAPMGTVLKNKWGDGPRGTPTVDGDRVYALSGQGTLVCAATADGKVLWQETMEKLGGKTPGWGYTESVLVDGQQVICTPGGEKGAIAALDKMTGKPLWQSTDFTDGAQYASIIAANHNGARQYIQLTMKSLVSVAAKDGKVLWKSPWPGQTAVIPTPIFRDGHVYVTAGYGVGCKLVKLGADHAATDVYQNKVMINHHGGVILVGDHLYGHSDNRDRQQAGWVCQNFKTGEEVWIEKEKLGKGAIGYADGMLYCLEEKSGTVVLIEASPKGWKEAGRFKLDPQSTIRSSQGRIWTHPVISNGKLYLRDQDLIYCFNVKG